MQDRCPTGRIPLPRISPGLGRTIRLRTPQARPHARLSSICARLWARRAFDVLPQRRASMRGPFVVFLTDRPGRTFERWCCWRNPLGCGCIRGSRVHGTVLSTERFQSSAADARRMTAATSCLLRQAAVRSITASASSPVARDMSGLFEPSSRYSRRGTGMTGPRARRYVSAVSARTFEGWAILPSEPTHY